jgi:hypothetical protein
MGKYGAGNCQLGLPSDYDGIKLRDRMVERLNFIEIGGTKHAKRVLSGQQHRLIIVPRHNIPKNTLSSIIGQTATVTGMNRQHVMQILFT